MLTLENIQVIVGKKTTLEKQILHGINLDIKQGEFVVIIGGNGAGKSTLFNTISGIVPLDSGRIWLAGRDITSTPHHHRARSISTVLQDPRCSTLENMTILENMAFALKRGQKKGLTPFKTQARIKLFKEKLSAAGIGLADRMHEAVSTLSGGQRQALGIIMATMQESKLLLLDEITAALDPASSHTIMEFTNRLVRDQKQTCMMITHNMAQAIRYGDRVVLLKEGKIIKEYDAATKATMTPAQLAQAFDQR